jgi:putative Ca2+/H+ antiporter (TMEM165/GDT1 family)
LSDPAGSNRGERNLEFLSLAGGFLTIVGTIFVAELTDKDALLLLSLATRMRPLLVFAAGSIAFTITSAVIVLLGSVLVDYVPITLVKLAGGVIMLCYALLEYLRGLRIEEVVEERKERLFKHFGRKELYAFLGILGSLMVLDLAGDATELLTVVFVAQFGNILLVFSGAVVALVAASAVETALGSRLGRLLSAKNVRKLSVVVFLIIGSAIILTSGILT